MALVMATGSGNWSDSTIWSGSVLPTTGDHVWANGKTIYIDTDIQVLSLRTQTLSGINGSGEFIPLSGVKISGTWPTGGFIGGLTHCLLHTGHWPVYTYGIITNAAVATLNNAYGVYVSGFGPTLYHSGNVMSGSVSGPFIRLPLFNQGGSVFITGGSSGANTSSSCIYNDSGYLSILGNITGGTSSSARAVTNNLGIVDITGNVVCGSNNGLSCEGAININGTLNIYGNVYGTGVSPSFALSNFYGTTYVEGDIYASRGPCWASSSFNARNILKGNMYYGTSGSVPFYGKAFQYAPDFETGMVQMHVSGNTSKQLYTALYTGFGTPSPNDVRSGVHYADSGVVGKMVVPAKESVAVGVAVDNASGVAVLTQAGVANSIGDLLL